MKTQQAHTGTMIFFYRHEGDNLQNVVIRCTDSKQAISIARSEGYIPPTGIIIATQAQYTDYLRAPYHPALP